MSLSKTQPSLSQLFHTHIFQGAKQNNNYEYYEYIQNRDLIYHLINDNHQNFLCPSIICDPGIEGFLTIALHSLSPYTLGILGKSY